MCSPRFGSIIWLCAQASFGYELPGRTVTSNPTPGQHECWPCVGVGIWSEETSAWGFSVPGTLCDQDFQYHGDPNTNGFSCRVAFTSSDVLVWVKGQRKISLCLVMEHHRSIIVKEKGNSTIPVVLCIWQCQAHHLVLSLKEHKVLDHAS